MIIKAYKDEDSNKIILGSFLYAIVGVITLTLTLTSDLEYVKIFNFK